MTFGALNTLYQRLLLLIPLATDHFNYDEPRNWYLEFPECAGNRQSPISINSYKAPNIPIPPVIFGLYDVFFEDYVQLQNTGHTIRFDVPRTVEGRKPFVRGGNDLNIYEAEEVHFHWGSPNNRGSEHKLNGRRYDLEMHILHRNTKYANVVEARGFEDGLAVIGVLFKVVKSPNVLYPGLNTIYNALNDVRNFSSTANTSQLITLGSLLGDLNREDFYTYQGSLTTPPCSEAVTWIILSEVMPISYTALPRFWRLRDSRDMPLLNTIRPLQLSQYRKVYHREAETNFWK